MPPSVWDPETCCFDIPYIPTKFAQQICQWRSLGYRPFCSAVDWVRGNLTLKHTWTLLHRDIVYHRGWVIFSANCVTTAVKTISRKNFFQNQISNGTCLTMFLAICRHSFHILSQSNVISIGFCVSIGVVLTSAF